MSESEETNVAADSSALLPVQRSEDVPTEPPAEPAGDSIPAVGQGKLVPEPSGVITGVLPVLVYVWEDDDRTRRAIRFMVSVVLALGFVWLVEGVAMLWVSHALGVSPGVVFGAGVGTMTLVPAGAVILARIAPTKKGPRK